MIIGETPYTNGIKKYSDQPILKTEKSSKGLKGIRIEKFALIPNKPGKIKLPEISIDWWSISEKDMKRTIIPAKIIEVMPNGLTINEEKSIREKDDELSVRQNENFKQRRYLDESIPGDSLPYDQYREESIEYQESLAYENNLSYEDRSSPRPKSSLRRPIQTPEAPLDVEPIDFSASTKRKQKSSESAKDINELEDPW